MNKFILLVPLLILIYSCQTEETQTPQPFEGIDDRKSSQFYIWSHKLEWDKKPVHTYLKGKVKKVSAEQVFTDGTRKEDEIFFDTLGRRIKHKYLEYTDYTRETSIPITEFFLYHTNSDLIREQVKYEGEGDEIKQIKRELYLYQNDLEVQYLHLDGNNQIVLHVETTFNNNGKKAFEKFTGKHDFIQVKQYIYRPDGELEKTINTGSSNSTDEKTFYDDEGKEVFRHKSISCDKGKCWETIVFDNIRNSSPTNDTTVTATSQRGQTIFTLDTVSRYLNTYGDPDNPTEQVVEKEFDKYGNCIKRMNYINGKLEDYWTVKIEFY